MITSTLQIERTDTFINLREVSKRLLLPQGRYCIVPCTSQRGEEGQFLVRAFVERRWGYSDTGRGQEVPDDIDVGGAGGGQTPAYGGGGGG